MEKYLFSLPVGHIPLAVWPESQFICNINCTALQRSLQEMRLSISPADRPNSCKSNAAHHFQLGHIPVIYLCSLHTWLLEHSSWLQSRIWKNCSWQIQPPASFAAVLRIHQYMYQALCWLPNDLWVNFQDLVPSSQKHLCELGNISNICRVLMVFSSDSSSYHPKRIRSMDNFAAPAPFPWLKDNSTVIEPEGKQASMGFSYPIRLAFAWVKGDMGLLHSPRLLYATQNFELGNWSRVLHYPFPT